LTRNDWYCEGASSAARKASQVLSSLCGGDERQGCTSDNRLPLARATGAEQPLNRNRLAERTTGEGPAARQARGLRGRANLKRGPCLDEDPFHNLVLVYRPFV